MKNYRTLDAFAILWVFLIFFIWFVLDFYPQVQNKMPESIRPLLTEANAALHSAFYRAYSIKL